jgi:hypothetical protein
MVRALLSGGAGVIISGSNSNNTSSSNTSNSNSSVSNNSTMNSSMKTDVNRPGKKSMTPLMYAAQVCGASLLLLTVLLTYYSIT